MLIVALCVIILPLLVWSTTSPLLIQPVAAAPSEPPQIEITRTEEGVSLTWPGVAEAVAYHVYRHTLPYFSLTSPLTTVTSLEYVDSSVVGSEYYYVVTAVNNLGEESLPSNQVGLFTVDILPDWNLLALPLLPSDTTLDAVLGTQLFGTEDPQTADRILVWDGTTQSYTSAWFCGG